MSKETPVLLPKIPSGLLTSGLGLQSAAVLSTLLDCFIKGKRSTMYLSEVGDACAINSNELMDALKELAESGWIAIPNFEHLSPDSIIRVSQICISIMPLQGGLPLDEGLED